MIDAINTLKNLNKEFPRYQLDTLLKILDCIVEKPEKPYEIPQWDKNITWKDYQVYCNDPYKTTCSPPDLKFMYSNCTKNHAVDKTSSKQNILTEEVNDKKFLEELKETL